MPESAFKNAAQKRVIIPSKFRTLSLDKTALLKFLKTVPIAKQALIKKITKLSWKFLCQKVILQNSIFGKVPPWPLNLLLNFRILNLIQDKVLPMAQPTIKIDWTEFGFHAMILSPVTGSVFIDPYAQGTTTNYISYFKQDLKKNELLYRTGPKKLAQTPISLLLQLIF